jgi:hypothetical protein
MAVDESWQHPGVGKVDDLGTGGNRDLRRRSNPGDALAFDNEDNVFAKIIAGGVEEMSSFDIDNRHRSRRFRLDGNSTVHERGKQHWKNGAR